MKFWTIYDHPKDYPNHFVARLWIIDKPTDMLLTAFDIEELRERFASEGMTRLERFPQDDPCIVEVWM